MKNLILCGFMGCGKTTVGRTLAEKLGTEFVDLDRYIEQEAGMPVLEIFSRFGEPEFRSLESTAAAALSKKTGIVIASGGGTVLDAGNVSEFKSGGTVILLDVPFSVISKRLENDTSRPLLLRPDRKIAMQQLFLARMPVYRAVADLIVCAGDRSPERVSDEIISRSAGPGRTVFGAL